MLMSAIQTNAPARTSSFAVASPMPLAPPVTSACRPSRRKARSSVDVFAEPCKILSVIEVHPFQVTLENHRFECRFSRTSKHVFRTALFQSRCCNHLQIRFSCLGNDLRMPCVHCCEVNQVTTHAKCTRTRMDKALGGLQRYATRGNDLQLRKGARQCFQIRSASNRRAWKDLHVVSTSIPGTDCFCGRKRTRTRHLSILLCSSNHFGVKTGADDKLRAGVDSGL